MITSGLFNSINGDRKYDAVWFARYFSTFIGNGVFPNPSTGLQVVENENMTTIVKPGDGWINGYFIVNDGEHILQHDIADGTLTRIDRIVMRLDFGARLINIMVRKGAYGSVPVAPTVIRNADFYELVLADVTIRPGVLRIIQGDIKDQRLNSELCGIVHGTVDQVDTSTIFNQYQSWFEEMTGEKTEDFTLWTAERKAIFEQWFVTITDILDTNVAGNLLILIHENEFNIKDMVKIKRDVVIPISGWMFNEVTALFENVINDLDVTSESVVDINIHVTSLEDASYVMSACKTNDGYITMYAKGAVEQDLIADYKITKQVI